MRMWGAQLQATRSVRMCGLVFSWMLAQRSRAANAAKEAVDMFRKPHQRTPEVLKGRVVVDAENAQEEAARRGA